MAVSVDHDHITGRNGVVPDHFVAGRRAVGHKKTVVGIENTRRIALGGADSAVMVEQLPQLFNRVANVRPQHIFTKKLVKHLANRAFQKRYAAGVTGAVP